MHDVLIDIKCASVRFRFIYRKNMSKYLKISDCSLRAFSFRFCLWKAINKLNLEPMKTQFAATFISSYILKLIYKIFVTTTEVYSEPSRTSKIGLFCEND